MPEGRKPGGGVVPMPLLADSMRNLTAALTIMAIVIAALVLGREILMPLAVGAIIAFMLAPIVRRLDRLRVPQSLAVGLTLSGTVVVLLVLSMLFSSQLLSLMTSLADYRANLIAKVRTVTSLGDGNSGLKSAIDALDTLGKAIASEFRFGSAGTTERPVVVTEGETGAPSGYIETVEMIASPVVQFALVILFALFLLLQYQDLRDRLVRVAGTDNISGTTAAMSDAGSRLSQLFLMQALLSAGYGALIAIVLFLLGVPNALLWGLVMMFMRFVPFIGWLLAAVPAVLLAAAVDPGWGILIATVALFGIGELVMGNLVEPMVLGPKVGLSPFAMVAAASFWTLIWGPVGLLLAAPLTMALVVLGRYVGGLSFFTVLLGDEEPLSAPQAFYHRLLIGNSPDAARQLEQQIHDTSFGEAGDAIVLPALHHAALDCRSAKLDRKRTEELRETLGETLDLLGDTVEGLGREPAGSGPASILVIAGHGPIDATAAGFLAAAARVAAPDAIARAAEASGLMAIASAKANDPDKVLQTIVVVTVGGLDPAQMRLIVSRAERSFPDRRVLSLTWGERESGIEERPGAHIEALQLTRFADLMAALAVRSEGGAGPVREDRRSARRIAAAQPAGAGSRL